jgi:hypothetical protein
VGRGLDGFGPPDRAGRIQRKLNGREKQGAVDDVCGRCLGGGRWNYGLGGGLWCGLEYVVMRILGIGKGREEVSTRSVRFEGGKVTRIGSSSEGIARIRLRTEHAILHSADDLQPPHSIHHARRPFNNVAVPEFGFHFPLTRSCNQHRPLTLAPLFPKRPLSISPCISYSSPIPSYNPLNPSPSFIPTATSDLILNERKRPLSISQCVSISNSNPL